MEGREREREMEEEKGWWMGVVGVVDDGVFGGNGKGEGEEEDRVSVLGDGDGDDDDDAGRVVVVAAAEEEALRRRAAWTPLAPEFKNASSPPTAAMDPDAERAIDAMDVRVPASPASDNGVVECCSSSAEGDVRNPARESTATSWASKSCIGTASNGPVCELLSSFTKRSARARCWGPIASFSMTSRSVINTTASPPWAPRPGIVIFRTVPSLTNLDSSRSTFVGLPITACKCAMVTKGGSLRRKFKISEMRVLENPPPRSGTGSNCVLRIWEMASGIVAGGGL